MGIRTAGMRGGVLAIVAILACAMLAGCATAPVATAPEQTAYQKAQLRYVYMEGLYAAQLRDAISMGAMAQDGKLSIEQLRIYRLKRDTLVKVKPLLETYDKILLRGGIPAIGQEQEITDMLNQLAALAGGVK